MRLVHLAMLMAASLAIGCGSTATGPGGGFAGGDATGGSGGNGGDGAGGGDGTGGGGDGGNGSGGNGTGGSGTGGGAACDPADCTDPPAPSCADAHTVLAHDAAGTCSEDDKCMYASTAVPCDAPPASACAGAVLHSYEAVGTCAGGACSYAQSDLDCGAAGCCGDHCCVLDPSSSADLGPLVKNGLDVSASGEIDTTLGCTSPSLLGDCQVVAPFGSPQVCVCRADNVAINTLTVKGERALAILAYETVSIGTLTVAPGAGTGFMYSTPETGLLTGGRGGSYATSGGNAGAAFPYGNAAIIPLVGGMDGQDAAAAGGIGGGAVQISAGQSIFVSGGVRAGGGGGTIVATGSGGLGGSGGGSGGAILLEAPKVGLNGILAANGGGGGGGWSSHHGAGVDGAGENGKLAATPAAGGQGNDDHGCLLAGYTVGGDGGDGAPASDALKNGEPSDSVDGCLGGIENLGAGGGGGGLGRIRINTLSGCNCNATLSPAASFGTVVLK